MRQITTERPTQHHEVWPTPYHAMARSGQKKHHQDLNISLHPPTLHSVLLLYLTNTVATQKSLGNRSAHIELLGGLFKSRIVQYFIALFMIRGIVHPKIKRHSLITLMPFQTWMIFFFCCNKKDVFGHTMKVQDFTPRWL